MNYNSIIHPNNAIILSGEKPITISSSVINTNTQRPFTTLLSKDIKSKFSYKDILIIRISKNKKECEFVSPLYNWGRINIPQHIIRLLDIANRDKIDFKIINKSKNIRIKENGVDLAGICSFDKGIKMIPRKNNLITLYYKKKIPITLPRFIKISPELVELLFLIHGDGHYQDKLYFANKSPELHKFVMEKFEKIFHIPRSLWKARLLISDTKLAEEAKDYWKNILNLDEKQFYNFSKSKFNTDKRGNLRIIIDKTIISIIFRFLFKKVGGNLDEKLALCALNGLLFAEGCASINNKSLHKITLSFNQKEKSLFEGILIRCNLNGLFKIKQNKNFVITGWDNQCLFIKKFISYNITPFSHHYKRMENLLRGFLEHSFTKTSVRYLGIINKKECTVKEIAQKLGVREDSVLRTLRKKRYTNFINIQGKGINKNPYKISINLKGKEFLKIFRRLESMLIKKESIGEFGIKPEERSVEELINYGIINLNKLAGPTSHEVTDKVKKILHIKKAGHSGTLE